MKVCVVCGEQFAPSNDNQVTCSQCRKNYSKGSLVSVQRGKAEGKRDLDNAPLPTVSEWVGSQRTLSKKLGLQNVDSLLGKVCEKCGKPVIKGSRISLCLEHYKTYRRAKVKENVRRHRARNQ